jgi:hypothetical protein
MVAQVLDHILPDVERDLAAAVVGVDTFRGSLVMAVAGVRIAEVDGMPAATVNPTRY